MKPLQEWVCDFCGNVIRGAENGFFEWVEDNGKAHSFQIVHHGPASPNHPSGDCYHHTDKDGRKDLPLSEFIPPDGLAALYSFLDVGPYHDPHQKYSLGIQDVREYTEILRRLTIPHYEEARLYWNNAKHNGFFDGANEVSIYEQTTLKRLIEMFGP